MQWGRHILYTVGFMGRGCMKGGLSEGCMFRVEMRWLSIGQAYTGVIRVWFGGGGV